MSSFPNSLSQALLARERARAEFHDWEKREEEVYSLNSFHFIVNFLVVVLAIW